MSTNIKILPSGRSFRSEGNSTLLEAGLRSGLALGYGCSNGNCGECLAKIISGEVKKTRHHDYPISAQERREGHVLMCCNTAISDVTLEALEARNSGEIPLQQITARVKSVKIVNDSVALVHLKTPRTNRLRFLAGQYVRLGGDTMPAAHHAVSSCPCDDMNLHFQIPGSHGDVFSDYVFERLKRGDAVNIEGPFGDFVLDDQSKRPLVFIARQTGFAPIQSLIEHAMALDITPDMHLVWITDAKEDRYLDNLCRSWKDAFDNFHYLPIESGPGEGLIDSGEIINGLGINPQDTAGHEFYIAGDDDFLRRVGNSLPTNPHIFQPETGV